jgi:hypothetical protein
LNTLTKSSILLKYFGIVNNPKIEMTNEVRELFEFASGGLGSGSSSRAASVQQQQEDEERVTEIMNGLIVS